MSVELLNYVGKFVDLVNSMDWKQINSEEIIKEIVSLRHQTNKFFKNYYLPIDKEICSNILDLYKKNVTSEFQPVVYQRINKKFKGNINLYVDNLFKSSIFTNEEKVLDLLDNISLQSLKKIINDPAFQLYVNFINMYFSSVSQEYHTLNFKKDSLYRVYMHGIQKFENDSMIYPDANFTLRLTYGKVNGYSPRNAVNYRYYSSSNGVLEKYNSGQKEYSFSNDLGALYVNRDIAAEYFQDSTIHICFITSNHTSGGNSGSPVLNADGNLIGLNFDRNWEGTISDLIYDSSLCRNIAVDVRYILFVIDKVGGARYLFDEMNLISN